MTHKTKGIVLRTINYGESSVIASVYTELFGIQSYIVKGVRKGGKPGQAKAGYFQPAALLAMEVYHNQLKNLQFIKEYQWHHMYKNVFFSVVKNAAAMFIVELLQHSLKQPEANPELFGFTETVLLALDEGNDTMVANLPIFYTLRLAAALGFRIQGVFSEQTPVADLLEGQFISSNPNHQHCLTGSLAQTTSIINDIADLDDLQNIRINRGVRRSLVNAYLLFFKLHIEDFGELRSPAVLQEVL